MTLTALMRKRNPPADGFEPYTIESALWQLKANCTHHGRKMLRVFLALVRKESQALADVRTLDDWAASDDEHVWHCGPTYLGRSWYCSLRRAGQTYSILAAHGATPDEARAKAAAWVRENK